MTFWAYMLHCRGGAYYVGHTDNLEYRVAQHKVGAIYGFTSERLPVELVWSQDFATRHEALEAERQIKGWSRAKKMALIRGDWDRISMLAKGKNGPSTGSGRTEKDEMPPHPPTVRPEPVEGLIFSLAPHPDAPPKCVTGVHVELVESGTDLLIMFCVDGEEHALWPDWHPPARQDGLWQTTCFELFIQPNGDDAYFEFNFAPSTEWAAYRFDGYREGMTNLEMPVDPHIERAVDGDASITKIALELDFLANRTYSIGLSAVIEETDGTKSYWALAHPPGKPDFHHPDCFALTLGAPSAA